MVNKDTSLKPKTSTVSGPRKKPQDVEKVPSPRVTIKDPEVRNKGRRR